ncbi:MAG: M48 family metalloprotease [Candidatus Ancillula sp.]|jgi:heat shock protein HtpX|nr:M48 family metalloprotease [Candidatus Ancillula sp.]
MYRAISKNKRVSALCITVFLILFTLIAAPFAVISSRTGDSSGYFISFMIIGIAFFYILFQYNNGTKLVLAASGAVEADEHIHQELYHICQELAIGYNIPMPKVYIITDQSPNAFATGRDPEHSVVAVTTGILEIMNREELEAVLAHEFAHIKNYDIRLSIIVFGMVAAIALFCDLMRNVAYRVLWNSDSRSKDDNSAGINAVVVVILVFASILLPIISAIVQMAISRNREYLADATAASMDKSPVMLASALEKLQNGSFPPLSRQNTSTSHMFFSAPMKQNGMNKLLDTHPPLEKRIARLLNMKDMAYEMPSKDFKNVPYLHDENGNELYKSGLKGLLGMRQRAIQGHIDIKAGEMIWVETATDEIIKAYKLRTKRQVRK